MFTTYGTVETVNQYQTGSAQVQNMINQDQPEPQLYQSVDWQIATAKQQFKHCILLYFHTPHSQGEYVYAVQLRVQSVPYLPLIGKMQGIIALTHMQRLNNSEFLIFLWQKADQWLRKIYIALAL